MFTHTPPPIGPVCSVPPRRYCPRGARLPHTTHPSSPSDPLATRPAPRPAHRPPATGRLRLRGARQGLPGPLPAPGLELQAGLAPLERSRSHGPALPAV
eukprot:scaffold10226_cov124-Isochrysis_galbana.AAC.3